MEMGACESGVCLQVVVILIRIMPINQCIEWRKLGYVMFKPIQYWLREGEKKNAKSSSALNCQVTTLKKCRKDQKSNSACQLAKELGHHHALPSPFVELQKTIKFQSPPYIHSCLSSFKIIINHLLNREFGLLNLMNTPEH